MAIKFAKIFIVTVTTVFLALWLLGGEQQSTAARSILSSISAVALIASLTYVRTWTALFSRLTSLLVVVGCVFMVAFGPPERADLYLNALAVTAPIAVGIWLLSSRPS